MYVSEPSSFFAKKTSVKELRLLFFKSFMQKPPMEKKYNKKKKG